jgi:ABC-type multidrug transport system fused ATPase/permease subunit
MSGHGVHVHGPHDHEVEHQAQKGGLGQQIAIFTAILATVGAVVSFLGGHTQNEALYYKNEAVLKKTQASNQWNYYQAKSMKQNLAEFAAGLTADPAKAEKYQSEAKRYSDEKKDIQKEAEKLEKESSTFNERAEHALHPHEKLAMSMTLLQIAIALASITVLTRKTWLLWGAGVSALGGVAIGVIAWF